MNVGNRIRKRRKELQITQIDLANKIGKSSQVISNWERGYTSGITAQDLQKLSVALAIPISYLVEEPKPSEKIITTDPRLQRLIDIYPKLNAQAKASIDALLAVSENYK